MNRNRRNLGRHAKKPSNAKKIILIVSLIAVFAAVVGTTLAYVSTKTGNLKNIFTATEVTCEVKETFADNRKTDVYITNTSKDVTAYIRAAVVVNWVDADGNISAQAPVLGEDYSLVLNKNTGWDTETSDGYYYFKEPMAAGGSTGILIEECVPLTNRDGYTLKVDIVANAIQSDPVSVVTENWGVTVNGTSISK